MKRSRLLLLFTLMFLTSCISEFSETADKLSNLEGVKWNPQIAVPLVDTRFVLTDYLQFLENVTEVRVEPDGLIVFIYRGNVRSRTAEEYIPVPDVSRVERFTLSPAQANTLSTTGSVRVSFRRLYSLNYPDLEIDSVFFKGGTLDIEVRSSLQHNARVITSIPEARKNMAAVQDTQTLGFTGSTPVVSSSSTGLNEYMFDFTKAQTNHSQMWIDHEILIQEIPGNPIGPNETIDIQIDLKNMAFQRFHGFYPATDITTATQNLTLNIFDNANGLDINLDESLAKVTLSNSFGVPIEAEVALFRGTSENTTVVDLTGFPTPLPIPRLGPNDIGKTLSDSFILDKTNSNLLAYINNQPHNNRYRFEVATNPSLSTNRNWFLDTSVVEGDVLIELPLVGDGNSGLIESTEAFDLGEENIDLIERLTIRLYTENGLPFDARAQIFFLDSNSNIVDSLIHGEDLIIRSADIDPTGKVLVSNSKLIEIELDQNRIRDIQAADSVIIRSTLNSSLGATGEPLQVRFYEEYEFLLQMGVHGKILIEEGL